MFNHSTPNRLHTSSALGYCITLQEPRTDIYIYIQLAVNLVACEHKLSSTQSCQLYIMTKNNGLSYICSCHEYEQKCHTGLYFKFGLSKIKLERGRK